MSSDSHSDNPGELLTMLEAMVEADQAPAGFRGSVAVGVRSDDGVRWWRGNFGRERETKLTDRFPDDADVLVGMGVAEARAAIGLQPMPAKPFIIVTGDEKLFQRFLDRFLSTGNLLDFRLQMGRT